MASVTLALSQPPSQPLRMVRAKLPATLLQPVHLTARAAESRRCYSWSNGKQGNEKEKVVILGSGWAGYAFARTLDPAKFDRIVISPRSYFVFTPLLASTSVGTLEFRTVLEPVRNLGVTFYQGWADDIDFADKTIRVEANTADVTPSRAVPEPLLPPAKSPPAGVAQTPGSPALHTLPPKGGMFTVPYDKLVIAVGAYSQTFNIPGVSTHAHFLRDVSDARRIRQRVLGLFELCACPGTVLSDADRRALLHFAVVGGGPTGIEFAAELHDLVRDDLSKIYPDLVPLVRITVYDVAERVLPMFESALAGYAMELFRRQGIEVRTGHHLEGIRAEEGSTGGLLRLRIREHGSEEVAAGMVVWSTGLMANPLVEKLVGKEFARPGGRRTPETQAEGPEAAAFHLQRDARTGGILTDAHLRAQIRSRTGGEEAVLPDVFVVGDCAVVKDKSTLPKTAQVASQQALYLAKGMNKADLLERPFRFRDWGSMAYLGSWRAIHQSSADELKGRAAWILWRTAYLTYSMSIRNKVMVPVYWAISWLFGRDISRF